MILQRYIGKHLVAGWVLVLLVLGSVFGLISFIQELDRTRFDYDGLAAARFVLFSLPQQMVSLAPVIALLGSVVALSSLDRSKELTIVSCTGFPRSRLLVAIILPTLALMAVLWLCMEYVTPRIQQSAEQQRHALRYRNQVQIPYGGVWSTDGSRYIHMDKLFQNGVPGDIDVYQFDEDGRLLRALHAKTAEVLSGRRWLLQRVREKQLVNGALVTRWHPEMEVDNMWAARELPTLTLSSESMSLSVLYRYSRYLEANGQPMTRYISVFWQKLMMPLTVGAMVLLATPVSINISGGRSRSFGLNMGIGALVGILFYLGAQIIFALGQLLHLSLPVVSVIPALIVALCAALLIRRMRW